MSAAFASARSLLRLELRRSIGLLLFPMLLAAAWYGASIQLHPGIYVWLDTSSAVRASVTLLGALAGGLSAWMAWRSHRHGMEEMLSITPHSSVARDLLAWAGTALWGIAAYVLFVAAISVLTWRNATWGGPLPGYFLVGLLAVVAYSAFGWAVGCWVSGRFTAPLLAVGIAFWETSLSGGISTTKPNPELLSAAPWSLMPPNTDVFQKILQVTAQQSLWFLGLGGVALTVAVLKNGRRNMLAWASLLGAVAMATAGLLSSLAAAAPLVGPVPVRLVPFEPVCKKGKITVCVHPAYAKLLPKTAGIVDQVAEPLEGIPGAPTRAVQIGGAYGLSKRAGDVAYFHLDGLESGDEGTFKQEVVMSLVINDRNATYKTQARRSTEDLRRCGGSVVGKDYYTLVLSTQAVVQEWLAERAGVPYGNMYLTGACPNTNKLVKRFANLDPAKRKVWLRKNFADLRAGKVTLKDLP